MKRALGAALLLGAVAFVGLDLWLGAETGDGPARGAFRAGGGVLLLVVAALLLGVARAARPGVIVDDAPDERQLLRLQAQSLAAEFTPSLAHDGNNALLSMRFQLAELERLHAGDAATDALVKGVGRDVDVLERLIRRMRELGIEREADRVRSLDLKALLEGVAEGMRTHLRSHASDLRLELPADGLLMAGDRRRLEQAVVSLLLHAVSRAGDGCELLLRARSTGDQVTLEIHDDGTLPRPDEYEAGRRALASTPEDRSGLLLWASRVCARRHQGSLHLERSELGGLCRRMVLPRDLDLGETNDPGGRAESAPPERIVSG